MSVPADSTSYAALGRLLAVGVAAGALIGAVVGMVAVDVPEAGVYGATGSVDWAVVAGSMGALVGIPVAVVVQVVAFIALLVFGRVRSTSDRRATAVAVAVVPVVAAGAVAWAVTAAPDASPTRQLLITLLAVGLALVVVRLTVRWCLAPMVDGAPVGRSRSVQ